LDINDDDNDDDDIDDDTRHFKRVTWSIFEFDYNLPISQVGGSLYSARYAQIRYL
jgi:hypothetical protein